MITKTKTPSVILILGARAPVAIEFARLWKKVGRKVLLADSTPIHFGHFSRLVDAALVLPSPRFHFESFQKKLRTIIDRYKIDLVIPTCEEIFYVVQADAIQKLNARLLAPDQKTIFNLHNKFTFQQMVHLAGLPTLATEQCRSKKEINQNPLIKLPHVLKPVYSRFAAKTKIFPQGVAENFICSDLDEVSPENMWLIQQYCFGKEYNSYVLASYGKLVAVSLYENIHRVGLGSGVCFTSIRQAQIEIWLEKFVDFHKLDGQFSFDFKIDPLGVVYALECNPRTTSGLHFWRNDVRFVGVLENWFHQLPCNSIIYPRKQPSRMMIIPTLMSIIQTKRRISSLLRSRDVLFFWDDPFVWVGQLFVFFHLLWKKMFRSESILSISTSDIEWNNELPFFSQISESNYEKI